MPPAIGVADDAPRKASWSYRTFMDTESTREAVIAAFATAKVRADEDCLDEVRLSSELLIDSLAERVIGPAEGR